MSLINTRVGGTKMIYYMIKINYERIGELYIFI